MLTNVSVTMPASHDAAVTLTVFEVGAAKRVASGLPGSVEVSAGCVKTAISAPEIASPTTVLIVPSYRK
jgi:hypothetical protein